jgi:hypothetical protein
MYVYLWQHALWPQRAGRSGLPTSGAAGEANGPNNHPEGSQGPLRPVTRFQGFVSGRHVDCNIVRWEARPREASPGPGNMRLAILLRSRISTCSETPEAHGHAGSAGSCRWPGGVQVLVVLSFAWGCLLM